MPIPIQHRPEHLVVPLDGELTAESAQAFVAAVDEHIAQYFYRRIEVVVSSPGGSTAALEHIVRALGRWRAEGVRVGTRVAVEAASAGAVLASLGDERIAEPGARLLYHLSRVCEAGTVTAETGAALQGELARTDTRIVGHLVERALRPRARTAHRAEPCDRAALARVGAALFRSPGRSRSLAERIGRALDAAARANDRKTLTRAYRALARIDRPISAAFAQTLRLIDRVGDAPDAPAPRAQASLAVPEWRALFPPAGEVPRALLTRHLLALGETGSGKTASVVAPVLAALARAKRTDFAGALVIDPKGELDPLLERIAPGRARRLHPERLAHNLMTGERWSIDAALAAGRWSEAATRILLRIVSFIPSSALRVLGPHRVTNPNAEFFAQEGTALVRDTLALVLMLTSADAPAPQTWIDTEDEMAIRWVDALGERARAGATRGPNVLTLCAWALDGPLAQPNLDDFTSGDSYWLFARIARHAMPRWGADAGEGRDLLARIRAYWTHQATVARQYAAVLATARSACAELAAPRIARTLYFGCEPGWRDAGVDAVDFARLAAPPGDGAFHLYHPRRDGLDALIAIALKAAFFEAVLDDPARVAGGDHLPLVAYVADECHRFVTADAVHGEQGFLDRSRSAGALCVLATQATRGIAYALSLGGTSPETNEAALDMVLANTATKLFFRSTDADTAARVEALCPRRPGFGPAPALRPLASLGVGECYAALPDGRFERRQLAALIPEPETTTDTDDTRRPPMHDDTNPYLERERNR